MQTPVIVITVYSSFLHTLLVCPQANICNGMKAEYPETSLTRVTMLKEQKPHSAYTEYCHVFNVF